MICISCGVLCVLVFEPMWTTLMEYEYLRRNMTNMNLSKIKMVQLFFQLHACMHTYIHNYSFYSALISLTSDELPWRVVALRTGYYECEPIAQSYGIELIHSYSINGIVGRINQASYILLLIFKQPRISWPYYSVE